MARRYEHTVAPQPPRRVSFDSRYALFDTVYPTASMRALTAWLVCVAAAATFVAPARAEEAGEQQRREAAESIAGAEEPAAETVREPSQATIVVDGDTLHGRIRRLDRSGIEFDPEFGKGTLSISYDELDHVETSEPFHFFDEDGASYTGRIIEIGDDGILVGDSDGSAVWIPVDMVAIGISKAIYDDSFMERTRAKWNHWSAIVDLGIEIDSGAVEKRKVNTTTTVTRNKRPWGATWFLEYAFESQKDRSAGSDPRRVTKDEFRSYLNVQRDIGQSRWLAYAFAGGEFDLPRNVAQRFYPAVGTAYRIVDSKRGSLEMRGGIGGVIEEFNDSPVPGSTQDNAYTALQLASTGTVHLPRSSDLTGFAMYMPAVQGPGKHWLFRFDLTLTIPLFDPLALRLRLSEINDDNPSGAGNNKTVFVTAFALRF